MTSVGAIRTVGAMDDERGDVVADLDVVPAGVHGFYVRHEYGVLYALAGISYVVVGMRVTFLLNWIVGPLWPIAVIWAGPPLVRRLTGWRDPLP
jgi:hypothetical protein